MSAQAVLDGEADGDHAFLDQYRRVRARYYAGTLTEGELAQWQSERLSAVLRHVVTRSPFYRRHLAGLEIDRITPRALSSLPFTTKDDLRQHKYDVLSGTIAEAGIFYETTGTTGAPTPCPRGPLDIATSNSAVIESWRRLFRARFGDRMPVVGLMGPSELYAFGDVFTAVTAELGACHVKIWPESPRVGFKKALRLIDELGVEVIVCAPALCLTLAKAAVHFGYDPARLPISMFLVLGEICTPQFAANVASVWPRAGLYPALYGSQEALCIATGAVDGKQHLAQLNYLAEVINPDTGAVIGDTGRGELVLTMLMSGIKPLIRYRTGDIVELTPAQPGAPLPGPAVDVIGREFDRVSFGDTRFHPAELETAVLDGLSGCLGYQLVIQSLDGTDEITARLDLSSRHEAAMRAATDGVSDRLRALTGVRASAVAVGELDPATNTGSFVSWKAARILDQRSEPDAAALSARRVAHRFSISG
jgi:benzoxazolinate moiety biosynthesis protein SgcD5